MKIIVALISLAILFLFTALSLCPRKPHFAKSQRMRKHQIVRHPVSNTPTQTVMETAAVRGPTAPVQQAPQSMLPSTSPDAIPSSISAGTTHSPIAVTARPYMEVEQKREQGRLYQVHSRPAYPRMCYFSPIQCVFFSPSTKRM